MAPQAAVIAARVSVANAMAMRRRGGVISVPFVDGRRGRR
jgi:hypothetical protein